MVQVAGAPIPGKTAPPSYAGLSSRDELIDRLVDGDSRLVTVVAPAGYAKTSLLAQWYRRERRSVAWVTLDSIDDDPAALLWLVAHAFSALGPKFGQIAESVGNAGGMLLTRIAPMLASALREAEEPFVLFIDDVHVLESTKALDILGVVVDAVPEHSQVVLASRSRLRSLARRQLATDAVEVIGADLRLDVTSAIELAAQAGVRIDDVDAQDWVARMDGWPAGIQLRALFARSGRDLSPESTALMSDYLVEEYFGGLPEIELRLMTDCSIVEFLVPELCDAILEASDSRAVLEQLQSRQLLHRVEHADGHGYRLHPMLSAHLRTRLEDASSERLHELHRRASRWYASVGDLPAAMEHALAAGDHRGAAELLAPASDRVYRSGRIATVARWVEQIAMRALVAVPAAAVVAGWTAVLTGDDDRADEWWMLLRDMQAVEDDIAEAAGWSFVGARAMYGAVMGKGGPAGALRSSSLAVERVGALDLARGQALLIHGVSLMSVGRSDEAHDVLADALRLTSACGSTDLVVLAESVLAILAGQRGDWDEVSVRAGRAREQMDRVGLEGYAITAVARAVIAYAALHEHDTAGVRQLALAMADRQYCTRSMPLIGIPARLIMARAQLTLGDHEAARMLLDEVDGILPEPDGREYLDGHIAAVRELLTASGPHEHPCLPSVALTVAEMRVLPYLQTHLTRRDIAERLFVSRNTVGTQITAIFRKLGVKTRAEAVQRALETGLLGDAAGR